MQWFWFEVIMKFLSPSMSDAPMVFRISKSLYDLNEENPRNLLVVLVINYDKFRPFNDLVSNYFKVTKILKIHISQYRLLNPSSRV